MSDIQKVKDWINSEASLPCQIWCEDPELNKGGMFGKSFLTYRILSRQVGRDLVGVRRRYSDFEKVQKELKERYSILGILVPALPPKKMMGSSSQESLFIKERTQGLTLFCECVGSNPFLRNDVKWRDFIRPDSTPYDSSADNTGEIMLEKALKFLEQPFKFTMTTRMDTVKDEVKSVEKQIDTMITALRALQTAEKAYLASSESVTNILQNWMETESQKVKSLGGYPFDCAESVVQTRDTVTTTLETAHRLSTSKYMARCFSPDYNGVLVISLLEGELARIEAFREMLKLHEDMIAGIGSIGIKLEKASAGKTKDSVPDLSKQLEAKQAEIANFYKGFVYFTLPMNSRMRSQTLRQAFLYLGSSTLAEGSSLRASAVSFLKEMQCNPESLVVETCKKLELLTLKPYDQSVIDYSNVGSFMQAPAPPAVLHGLFEAATSGNYAPLFAPIPAISVSITSSGKSAGSAVPSAPPAAAVSASKSGAFTDSDSSDGGSETVFGKPSGGKNLDTMLGNPPSNAGSDTLWK